MLLVPGAGDTLLSGSDDTQLGIWDVATHKKSAMQTGHSANIFCTRFMPGTGAAHASRSQAPSMLLATNVLWRAVPLCYTARAR
jgi:WD40 repeat protein